MLNVNSLPPFVEVSAEPEERTAFERLKSFTQHENLDGVKFPVPSCSATFSHYTLCKITGYKIAGFMT